MEMKVKKFKEIFDCDILIIKAVDETLKAKWIKKYCFDKIKAKLVKVTRSNSKKISLKDFGFSISFYKEDSMNALFIEDRVCKNKNIDYKSLFEENKMNKKNSIFIIEDKDDIEEQKLIIKELSVIENLKEKYITIIEYKKIMENLELFEERSKLNKNIKTKYDITDNSKKRL